MLSSTQIAQMHSGQQQAFAAQASYTHQISSQMPQAYSGGIGAAGQFGMGMSYGPGGGFSYGQNMSSLGGGMGNAVVSGMAGVGQSLFNPMTMGIGGALGGFKLGGFRGAMIGGGLGAMAGGVVNHVFGSMAAGAQEQTMLNRTLSQFQFQNPSSSTGRGFDQSQARAIGDMVRQMERMPEMLTSFGELNRIMDKMGQMGLMQGAKNAGEFMKKFQSTVGTLKDMAKMMGTTMEGALQAFGDQRMAGFYNKADILKNTMVAQTTGAITGMSTQQVVQMQQAGAQLSHSMGGSRKSGANMMARNLGQIGMANQMGIISNDQIMEMTGKEGSEGIADIAGQMSQLSYRMAQSAPGTLMTLALAETGAKGYTGRMDQSLAERVRKGQITLGELKEISRKKISQFGRGNKLFYGAHGKRMRAEMASATGAEGQAMMLQEILGERGWQNPDAQNLVMQRFGATEEQANLLQQLTPNLQDIQSQMSSAGKSEARSRAISAISKERFSPDAIKHRIKKKLEHTLTDPLKDLGNSIKKYVDDYVEGYTDDLTGQYRTMITKDLADTMKMAASGNKQAAGRLTRMQGYAQKYAGGLGGDRLDVGAVGGLRGAASRFMHWAGGSETKGEQIAGLLGGLDKGQYLTRVDGGSVLNPFESSGASQLQKQGATVLTSTMMSGNAVGLTEANRNKALDRLRELGSVEGGAAEYSKMEAKAGDMFSVRHAYTRALNADEVLAEQDTAKRTQLIYKNMEKQLAREGKSGELSKLRKAGFSAVNIVAAMEGQERKLGNKYMGSANIGAAASLLGDLGGNKVAISAALKSHEKAMRDKYKQSEKSFGWDEITKLVGEGDEFADVLVGAGGSGGIMGQGRNSDLATALNQISQGQKYEDLPAGQRVALDRAGLNDPEKLKRLQAKLQEDPSLVRKLMSASEMSPDDVKKYLGLTAASGLSEVATQLQQRGRDIEDRLDARKGDIAKLGKDSAFVKALQSRASALTGVKSTDDMSKVLAEGGDADFNLAQMLSGMKGEERKAAEGLVGENVVASANKMTSLRKQWGGKVGKKMGDKDLEQMMQQLGYGTDKGSTAYQEKLTELKKTLTKEGGMDKLDKGELEDIIKGAGKETALGVSAKDEAKSKYMSEEQVAQELTKMSENNVKVAAVLSNLASGKTGKDAFQTDDVIKPSGVSK